MHAPLKLISQVYLILTRLIIGIEIIIVEISAKYIDLMYMLYICHESDKMINSVKDLMLFIFFCFYDCMLVYVPLEHVLLI